ncbi:TlpA disulfide reductase family protein [Bremerella alba]|uniref:Thiol-disulfide oxidoreductase ResA n=1 Tax=Bremerella alba TaxID=980252 RepID=A0A7V9A832_9BACT|nr:TlpA disulfide reductase family protein [Bremerella alba]MBA2115641.1 Thiol-disulfide oxidoreductase ResA [Bremerella alba]
MLELQKMEAGQTMNRRWLILGLLLAVWGCGKGASQPEMAPPVETVDVTPEKPTEVTTKVMDYQGIQMLVESYRGKVVVVDYWSTDCPPCIKELPGLVEMHNAFPADDLKCITVSLDYIGLADEGPETYQDKVMPILKHVGATFDNIIAADDSETMLKKLKLAAPPAVLVYDRDGKLAKRFDNEEAASEADGFTYEKDIKPLVAELVKAKP